MVRTLSWSGKGEGEGKKGKSIGFISYSFHMIVSIGNNILLARVEEQH